MAVVRGNGIFLVLIGAMFLAASSVRADLANCEICKSGTIAIDISYCRPPHSNEVGSTICEDHTPLIGGVYCTEGGWACSVIDVSGGGGGGTGGGSGGGTQCAYVQGFCPAECFSCGSSGGGRPAA
jgi:hypothetical protein